MNRPGQILIITIIFLTVVLILVSSTFSSVAEFLRFGARSVSQEQARNLAEAGIEKTLWQLNQTTGSYTGETNTPVGTTGTFTVTVADKAPTLKTVTSTGYIPNNVNPRSKQTIKADILISTESVSFGFAIQTGSGGVNMANTATIHGSVYSNGDITGSESSQIDGDAYAVGNISSPKPTVLGTKNPNQPLRELPEVDYQNWKDFATAGGTTTCSPTCTIDADGDIGPQKYEGNLHITNNAIVTMQGPVYVTGNFSISQGNTTLRLDPAFGSNGTIVIIDGTADLTQGGLFEPTSANPPGHIMLITTSTSAQAIEISQSGATAIFYALEGGAILTQTAHVTTMVAQTLTMSQSSELDYDPNFTSSNFSAGPGGSWQIKKGTYHFTSSP